MNNCQTLQAYSSYIGGGQYRKLDHALPCKSTGLKKTFVSWVYSFWKMRANGFALPAWGNYIYAFRRAACPKSGARFVRRTVSLHEIIMGKIAQRITINMQFVNLLAGQWRGYITVTKTNMT
jgi:hypothetical protein